VKTIAEKSVAEVMGFLSGEVERKRNCQGMPWWVCLMLDVLVWLVCLMWLVWLKPCDTGGARTTHRTLMRNSRAAHHYLSQPLNNGAAGNAAPQSGVPIAATFGNFWILCDGAGWAPGQKVPAWIAGQRLNINLLQFHANQAD
jgi:hypothetical protein